MQTTFERAKGDERYERIHTGDSRGAGVLRADRVWEWEADRPDPGDGIRPGAVDMRPAQEADDFTRSGLEE